MNTLKLLVILLVLNAPFFAGAATFGANQIAWFDGVGDYISVASNPDLMPEDEITIEAWIFPLRPDQHGWFISKGDGQNSSSSRSYEFVANGGVTGITVSLFLGTTNWALVSAPAAESNWLHVAVTYVSSSGICRLFTNGVLAVSTGLDASGTSLLQGKRLRQTTLPLIFGGVPSAFARGGLDDVRIWRVARNGALIQRDMTRRLTGSESNLVAYWTFENSNANDVTSHGHDGAFFGNVTTRPEVIRPPVPGTLAIQLYAGLTLTGSNALYSIQTLRACLKKDNIRMDAGMGSAWGWSGQKKRMNGLT